MPKTKITKLTGGAAELIRCQAPQCNGIAQYREKEGLGFYYKCEAHISKDQESGGWVISENDRKSEKAYRAILARYGEGKPGGFDEAIIDCLTDIMHLAPDYGDFDEMLNTARMHFNEEAKNENK